LGCTTAMGQTRPWAAGGPTSGLTPIADLNRLNPSVSEVPCVDGSLLARVFFTVQLVGCGPVCAVHMTAGHNALRGSGPGQKLAFDDAMAHCGLS
jgi:hypothetical protein